MGNTKELNHISLCAGYGGIDLGLSRALGSIRTVCFVEVEAFCIENLVAKIEGGWLDPAPVFTDLKKFPWESFSGRVDILTGGFPCQPFSAAGRKAGDEDPRHLWPHITDGIKRLGRPALVLFENVEGIISSKLKSDDWSDPKGTSVLLHVLRELERLGYDAEAGVFSAREVGAPHQRKRVFIMGVRSESQVQLRGWASPTLGAAKAPSGGAPNDGEAQYRLQNQVQSTLPQEAQSSTHGKPQELHNWATPTAREYKNACLIKPITPRKDGRTRLDTMAAQIHHQELHNWATHNTLDHLAQRSEKDSGLLKERIHRKDGIPRIDSVPIQVFDQQGYRGKLNPRWVESLMGLPIGWVMPSCQEPWIIAPTNLDYSETESCLAQPNEHLESCGEILTLKEILSIDQHNKQS